jgi:hypothetical protein
LNVRVYDCSVLGNFNDNIAVCVCVLRLKFVLRLLLMTEYCQKCLLPRQSSLGYLFVSGEAPAPAKSNAEAAPKEVQAVNNVPASKPAPAASEPVDVTKQIPAGIHSKLEEHMIFHFPICIYSLSLCIIQ